MNCLKCGKEAADNQFFCPACLDIMKQYPVKPGTPVHIPHRPKQGAEKKSSPRTRDLPTAELLSQYKKVNRWLTLTIVVLCAVLCLVVFLLIMTAEDIPGLLGSVIPLHLPKG